MTADEFVEQLALYRPTQESLVTKGYPATVARDIIDGLQCTICQNIFVAAHEDALLDLIHRYDTSKIEIGFIRLNPELWAFLNMRQQLYTMVGAFEGDPLASNRETGEVVLLDSAAPDFVMAKVAERGAKFLDVLIEIVKVDFAGTIEEVPKTKAFALHCARVAGVDDNALFYEMLIGSE